MLKLQNIEVSLGHKQILKSINLEIQDGEFVSVLGPSGCGKSTLLKTICGFVAHQAGSISADAQRIDSTPIHLRGIAMVFQDLRLFPNMVVWENVAFPLKMQGAAKEERKKYAYELLHQVSLSGFENRKIMEISGGQQQRVALARAFAARPKYLLLDEPFSGLDEELRIEMRQLLCELHKIHRISVLFVTHDKGEALMISDKIAVMDQGEILQFGTPRELYETPKTLRIAEYFGERNFVHGEICGGVFHAGVLSFPADLADGNYCACIPYHAVAVCENGIPFEIEKREYTGYTTMLTAVCGLVRLCLAANSCETHAVGESAKLVIHADRISYFPA